MSEQSDTIYALSSGGLPSGVAVVRISGPQALTVCQALVGRVPDDRHAAYKSIRKRDGSVIDRGIVLSFGAPRSFTGEDCVELHVHGGRAVIDALLQELGGFDACRMAEAGEFSRRAFENGKLDLVEIEGLADLLAAETEMQRRLAIEQSSGGQSAVYSSWRDQLIKARALIEAELDFSDEGDIPGSVSDQIWERMDALAAEIANHLARARVGEIVREGFKIAIVGPPNSGKSSLLNALAKREVAIVTEYAGTTRDVLHCDLNIEGYSVRLFDTAGLRETEDVIEQEGIRRARALVENCDLVLSLCEIGDVPLSAEELNISAPIRYVGTKADTARRTNAFPKYDVEISVLTGVGIGALVDLILKELGAALDLTALAVPTRRRHAQHLGETVELLQTALREKSLPLEIRAEYLRSAGDCLGRLTGRIDVEALLGAIFSEFCVGK